jgi:hypothetical protein
MARAQKWARAFLRLNRFFVSVFGNFFNAGQLWPAVFDSGIRLPALTLSCLCPFPQLFLFLFRESSIRPHNAA